MTSLVELRVHRIESPLVRPFVTAVRRVDSISVMLVEAIDSDGRRGWGEAPASWRVTGESPESIRAVVLGPLAQALKVADTSDWATAAKAVGPAVVGNSAAKSAVECALIDVCAQAAGVSVAELLGAETRVLSVRTDYTLSAGDEPAIGEGVAGGLIARARAHYEQGFTCLKLKTAAGDDLVRRLTSLRAELGDEAVLRVDANQAWNAEEAIRVIRDCEDAGIGLEFVEQPVAAGDIAGLARVTAAVDTPVLADETVWTTRDLLVLMEQRAADLVNIKLAKTAGPSEALRLAKAARVAGIGVIVGCMMESSVGVASAVSLAVALAPDTVHDLDAAHWLHTSPVAGGLAYERGRAVLSEGPGLGFRGMADKVQP